ncbi:MAG: hypothetical protein ACRYG2_27795 [Janthinobacterium lividum]
MSETSSVLLTSGTMGPAEWTEVAQRLTSSGLKLVVDTELVYDRGMGASAGTQLERLRQDAFWASTGVNHVDVAVGFNIGAGPAAAMVSHGLATSAVLIDPDLTALAMAHVDDDLDVFVPDDADLELALEISERLVPFTENLKHGPFTREMVDIFCGAFTGDRWRARQAELVAPFLMNNVLVDRSSLPTEDDLRASDWASATNLEAVQVWFSAGRDRLAEYLRSRGFNVSVTSWGRSPWLESPAELAAAVKREAVRARQLR